MGEINLEVTERSWDNKQKSFKAKMNLNFFHLYFCTCGSEVVPLCSITVLIKWWNSHCHFTRQTVCRQSHLPLSFMSPGGHRTPPNGYEGSLGLGWQLCVFLCVCVDVCVCVHTIYIHTWLPICFVLHVLNASIFSDCVCVCFCLTANVFIKKKSPQAVFPFSLSISRHT